LTKLGEKTSSLEKSNTGPVAHHSIGGNVKEGTSQNQKPRRNMKNGKPLLEEKGGQAARRELGRIGEVMWSAAEHARAPGLYGKKKEKSRFDRDKTVAKGKKRGIARNNERERQGTTRKN